MSSNQDFFNLDNYSGRNTSASGAKYRRSAASGPSRPPPPPPPPPPQPSLSAASPSYYGSATPASSAPVASNRRAPPPPPPPRMAEPGAPPPAPSPYYTTPAPAPAAPPAPAAAPNESSAVREDNDGWFVPSAASAPAAAMPNGSGQVSASQVPSYYGSAGPAAAAPPPAAAPAPVAPVTNPFGFNSNPNAPPSAASFNSAGFSGGDAAGPSPFGSGSMDGGSAKGSTSYSAAATYDDFADEPPLLEELGINFDHILLKSRAVILPFSQLRYFGRRRSSRPMDDAVDTANIDRVITEEADLAGPIVFALLLGGELLLSGKIHFGYIYTFGLFGCGALSLILNLISPAGSVSFWAVVSVLGYSLIPVNLLAGMNAVIRINNLGGWGLGLSALIILWCTVASTRLFERGCGMRDQRYLVAYPAALLYSAFVMITIF